MAQNNVTVQRLWQKLVSPASGLGNMDALYQFFTQLNALVNDCQNQIYNSAGLTAGATTSPTNGNAFFGVAGGGYFRVAATQTFPAAGMGTTVIGDGKFGIFYFAVDSAATLYSYPSPTNGAATRGALTFPVIPATQSIVGAIEVAPSGTTFTPGSDNLNKGSVNATAFNFTGDTGFTAMGMTELDIA